MGFVGVAFTLLLNNNSLKASNQTASTDTYLKTYAWTLDIDKAFVDNPDLKSYLKKDFRTSKSPTFDNAKAAAFAEYMLDIYDAVLNNTNYFKSEQDTKQQWMETITQQFKDYPMLRYVFVPKFKLYGPGLNNAYDEYRQRLGAKK